MHIRKGFPIVFSSPSRSRSSLCRSTQPSPQQEKKKVKTTTTCCRLPSLLRRAPRPGAAAAARRRQHGPTASCRASRAGARSDKLPGAPGARPRAGCPRSRGRSARSAALTRTLPRDERRARTRRMARGCIALLDVVLRRIIPRAAPGKRYNNRWRPCRSSASFVNNAQKNRVNFMQQTTDLELRGRAHVGRARNTRLAATPASDAQRLAGTPTRASRRATVFSRAKSCSCCCIQITAPCQATGQQSRIFGAGTGLAAHSLGAASLATLGAVPLNLHCVLTVSCARKRHVELKASTFTAFS